MLFVGENRSKLAKKMNVTWKDGKLAAKQLFDALKYSNIDPDRQQYCNWFEDDKNIVRQYKGIVIAMGHKVSNALKKENIKHIFIYHPATRGKIRKKELYCEHVKNKLNNGLRKI